MPDKISGYTADGTSNPIQLKDLMDFSNTPDGGTTYDVSKKIEVGELMDFINSNAETLYNSNGTISDPRTITLNDSLVFDKTGGNIAIDVQGTGMLTNSAGVNIDVAGGGTGNIFGLFSVVRGGASAVDVIGGKGTSITPNGERNIGWSGSARDGSERTIGLHGIISGGGTVAASEHTSAVEGRNTSGIGLINYGGRFETDTSSSTSDSTTYGVWALADNGGVGSTTSIGGYFEAINATDNYALLTGDGDVGIGNSAPLYKFHVTGETLIENDLSVPVLKTHDNGRSTFGSVTDYGALVNIRGTGNTVATTSLLVENSSGTDLLKVTDDGEVSIVGNINQIGAENNLVAETRVGSLGAVEGVVGGDGNLQIASSAGQGGVIVGTNATAKGSLWGNISTMNFGTLTSHDLTIYMNNSIKGYMKTNGQFLWGTSTASETAEKIELEGVMAYRATTAPTGTADVAKIYAKTVSGISRIFTMNSDGTENEVT